MSLKDTIEWIFHGFKLTSIKLLVEEEWKEGIEKKIDNLEDCSIGSYLRHRRKCLNKECLKVILSRIEWDRKNNSLIKESASKPIGSTKPSKESNKVITEETQVANRFKKLAGIING